MEMQHSKQPQYVDETETLLMSPYFADEARADALYTDFESLGYEELGARELVYGGALRILAHARAEERAKAHAIRGEAFRGDKFNDEWRLTRKKIASIAGAHHEQVGRLARKIAILNNAEIAINEELGGEGYDGLLDYQKTYLRDIVSMMQRGPAPVIVPPWYEINGREPKLPGILLKAPTGTGKTALIARTAVSIGAGTYPNEKLGSSERVEPIRIALAAPSQALIAQLSGETGKAMLRKLAPNLTLTTYYSKNKDPTGDIVIVSNDLFIKCFRDGQLDGERVDYVFIDEVHHLTEPKFLRALLEQWDGPTIGFTATPAYKMAGKDSQDILRYGIDHGDMEDFMQQGHINKFELYTARFKPEDVGLPPSKALGSEQRPRRSSTLTRLVGEFILPLVTEGRRGIIFCEPGGESLHARNLCGSLGKIALPDGRHIRAEAIGLFQGTSNSLKNKAAINRFNSGYLDVLATTVMGQEGLDFADIDFVALATKLTSPLQFQQMIGRGSRLSSRFDTTVIGQFIALGFGQRFTGACSLQSIFGSKAIQQGYVVGAADQADYARGVEQFPELLRTILQKTENLASDLFKQERQSIPTSYVSLDDIIADKDIGRHAARLQLIRNGYDGIQQSQEDTPMGHRNVFFEPAALTFFSDSPTPPQVGKRHKEIKQWAELDTVVTASMLAEYFGTSEDMIYYYLSDKEQSWGKARRVANHSRLAWSNEEAALIRERLERKLFLPAHVLTFKGVADLLGVRPTTLKKHVTTRWDSLGIEDIEPRGTTKQAIPWQGIAKIQAHYGLRGEVTEIDYSRLPRNDQDTDPDRVDYARSLQRLVLPVNWLPPYEAA